MDHDGRKREGGGERREEKMRWIRVLGAGGAACCWHCPLRAGSEGHTGIRGGCRGADAQEIYPDPGERHGQPAGTERNPAQLQEAERTLAQSEPAAPKPAHRVAGGWRLQPSAGRSGAGPGCQTAVAAGGDARHYERSQSDNWQVRGLRAARVVADGVLSAGHLLPVAGGRVVGMMPLMNGLYATATLIGDRVQVALSSEQARVGEGNIHTGQSATGGERRPGQWLTVGSFPQPKAAGRPRSPIHQAWAGPAAANARPADPGHAPVNQPVSGADPEHNPATGGFSADTRAPRGWR